MSNFQAREIPDLFRPEPQPFEPIWGYWPIDIHVLPHTKKFLGRILRHFGSVWRYVFRSTTNEDSFLRLAYGIIWIAEMKFTVRERRGCDLECAPEPYVRLTDLPAWEVPRRTVVPSGSTWFVLAATIHVGMAKAKHHYSEVCLKSMTIGMQLPKFVIMTPTQICMVRPNVRGKKSSDPSAEEWSFTETKQLWDEHGLTDAAIELILFVVNTCKFATKPPGGGFYNRFNALSPELQYKILGYNSSCRFAAAKLACENDLPAEFNWLEHGLPIQRQYYKARRTHNSPVESQILLNGIMSGLSYQRVPCKCYIQRRPQRSRWPRPFTRRFHSWMRMGQCSKV